MSTNRQSQLESDFLTDFKDGARADAVELITNRTARYGRMPSAYDSLKSCRLACLIFEVGVLLLPDVLDSRTVWLAAQNWIGDEVYAQNANH